MKLGNGEDTSRGVGTITRGEREAYERVKCECEAGNSAGWKYEKRERRSKTFEGGGGGGAEKKGESERLQGIGRGVSKVAEKRGEGEAQNGKTQWGMRNRRTHSHSHSHKGGQSGGRVAERATGPLTKGGGGGQSE